ncbi:amidase [Paracoccus laeviglucosivorans]|uniref:Asp-tRNAAsn/Glu-tRNAGln amidotransferase A subunit n=1 Tax=Paracoccus laeviglucosivorans TaxID=1197861 RepID=A0A521FDX2_9RHOB|nr:amidase [Paracoccus laeviglucosivorans]SMO93720.1 Asp-tRNAAsn/Glu-tRNAGln amidotransferase A subunit [Paracoccus laeviglucosivorans]
MDKPASLDDLPGLTVAGIHAAFDQSLFTAEDLTRACLARIKAVNGHLNAIIFADPSALDQARDIDRRRAAGEVLGPLAGVPVVIKDSIDMVGFPTTAGWSLLYSGTGGIDLMPERDAPVAARMKAAGAVILGKTNIPILSWTGSHANDSWAGPTLNAAMPDRLPGGSSAGTATAVAAHLCVLGLAEETGGSIQNPAAAQGLVGIKPTIGLVPNTGVVPLSSNRDVVGPIARNVRDAAVCLDAISGFSNEDPKTLASVGQIPAGGFAAGLSPDALRGKRLGLYGPGWRKDALCDETRALYEQAQQQLRAAGAILIEDPFAGTDFSTHRQITPGTPHFDGRGLESLPHDMTCYLRRLGPNAAIRNWHEFIKATAAHDVLAKGAILGYLHELPDFAAALSDPETPPALPTFAALKAVYLRLIDQVFANHALDGLVYPQMQCELPDLHSGLAIRETTVGELNIAGIPAVTIPAGCYASGAPFGLIFLGRLWSEPALLNMAYGYEQLAPG